MKTIIISLILIIKIFAGVCVAQTSITDNYPLKKGNVFFVKKTFVSFFNPTIITYHRTEITKDTTLNSKKYCWVSNYMGAAGGWWRLDSISGKLMIYDPTNSCPYYNYEKPIDSLWASLGDTIIGCGYTSVFCNDTSYQNTFGITVPTKAFYWYQIVANGYYTVSKKYAQQFGLVHYKSASFGGGGGGSVSYDLIGCIIDNVVYGDTNTTSILQINTLASSYSLHQNYPNPFNPVTKIKYEIKSGSEVKLVVYDVSGKLINVLVSQRQSAGTYQYTFEGSGLSSGVYFYSLEIENEYADLIFRDVKKMIIVK